MRATSLDLGVIGNSSVAALVDRRGRIVWYCLPRLDGDPVFCSLLDEQGAIGFAEVSLEDLASSTQEYSPNTAILVTTLTDRHDAQVRITDFVPRFKQYDRIFRPAMIVRRVEPIEGNPRIRLRVRPRFEYGRREPVCTFGSNHIRYVSDSTTIRLTTDAPVSCIAAETAFALTHAVTLILGPDESLADSIQRIWGDFHERTVDYWIEWVRYLSVPFEWQDVVIRAAITLKLCSFEETGAIVAALTTSIPEAPGTIRNWDYRYCWLRDSYFVVHALNRLGATKTMEGFLDFITSVATEKADGDLRPVYGIVPGQSLDERQVDSLSGYRGHRPVRVGNRAAEQRQNDGYGSIILGAAQMFFDRRLPRQGDLAMFQLLERLGTRALEVAFEPDAGLWELRGQQRVHVHSAAMCWAAADRLSRIAERLGLADKSGQWRKSADWLRAEILERSWRPDLGVFTACIGGSDIDASLLLLQEIGLVAATDPRFVATVEVIGRELRQGKYLFRYRSADDFGEPKNAFNLCTFWHIDALTALGRTEEARDLFEHMIGCRNHLGLLSEHIDPSSGELWGNYPQTYAMVGLIVSAMRLSKSWEAAFWRGW